MTEIISPPVDPLFPVMDGLGLLDLGVLVAYLGTMVLIGIYCSLRQTSTDEYLLGGRTMSPLLVGISLIATLLSTVTYLGAPGDMIQFGPAFACGILAMPFWLLVVSRVWIPFFMRYRLTSIYEYAELRFSRTARLFAATLFVLMRLGWMGMIVYTAGDAIAQMTANLPALLEDRFGLALSPQHWLLLVMIAMLATTTAYTVVGGIRAVMWTDFVQFIVMMAGVLLAIGAVWVESGVGPAAWWQEAARQRREMVQWFSTDWTIERTLVLVVAEVFFWRICVQCSDQVATQRYFSTGGIKNAVRANVVAATADFAILALFAVLGLALLHYFTSSQHSAQVFGGAFDPHNSRHARDAFPRFILHALPGGVSGLVVAALLSAAMSSLSSGINSVSAVIVTDLRRDSPHGRLDSRSEVQVARGLSFLIGGAVAVVGIGIALYLSANPRHQNITDLANRVFNVFVGPLGGLFMAGMFLPWVGNWAAIGATAIGLACGLFFSFFREILGVQAGPSTLLITPATTVLTVTAAALFGMVLPKPAKSNVEGHTWWTRHHFTHFQNY